MRIDDHLARRFLDNVRRRAVCLNHRQHALSQICAKLKFIKLGGNLSHLRRLQFQLIRCDRKRNILHHCREIAIQFHLVKAFAKAVTHLAFHLISMIQQISQRSVLHNPLLCRLFPHSGNARQVIRRIAPQRGEIRILLRRQPILLLHRIRGKPVQRAHTAHRVKHRGCTIHQLKRVAVTRDNQGFKPKGLGGCRKRGDNIVGLVVLLLQGGDPQWFKNLLNQINLALKLLGRGVALSLILGKHHRTERVAPNVKRHGHVRRLLLLDEVSEHRQKPIHRVRVLATRRGEVLCRQGIKRAKSHRMPINEHQTTRSI